MTAAIVGWNTMMRAIFYESAPFMRTVASTSSTGSDGRGDPPNIGARVARIIAMAPTMAATTAAIGITPSSRIW
jgi:hypothetical protein